MGGGCDMRGRWQIYDAVFRGVGEMGRKEEGDR